jgi:hypothetical protein
MSHSIDNSKEISTNLLDSNGKTKKSGIRAYRGSDRTENGLELFFLCDPNCELAFENGDSIESDGKRFYFAGAVLNCEFGTIGNHHDVEVGEAEIIEAFLDSGEDERRFPYRIVVRFPKDGLPDIIIGQFLDEGSAVRVFKSLNADEIRKRESRASSAQCVLIGNRGDVRSQDFDL